MNIVRLIARKSHRGGSKTQQGRFSSKSAPCQ